MADFPGVKHTRSSKAGVKLNSTRRVPQASKRHQEHIRKWVEHAEKLRGLASCLPNVPDNSSNLFVRSIEREALKLLDIYNKMDLQPIEDPRDMDDQEARLGPNDPFYWTDSMIGG